MIKKILLGTLLIVLIMLTGALPTHAAGSRPLVTIAPFLQQVQVSPADSVKNFNVYLTNSSTATLSFHLSVADFGSLDETGGLVFAGNNASSLTKKYGLSSWLRLGVNDLSLAPGKTATVTATIINDVSLQPGGHYAAIIASVKNQNPAAKNQIDIKQELSALILATKTGGDKYDLHLNNLQYDSSWWSLPGEVSLRFYNPGNVHVVPRGLVKLIAPNGQVVSQGVINDASTFVLPQTYRQIQVDLKSVGHSGWRPGLYHLRVDYRYDGLDRYASKTFTARFLNLSSLLLIVAVIAVIIWLTVKIRHLKKPKPPTDKKNKPATGKTVTKKPIKVVVKNDDE
ncbi:MAG TPA: hypothetical protein VFC50_03560 [Candidatus Dormibacteraeota bacterium]|nr:hypothetical protein [Candidatus Dormibacteraeota bacterium]